MWRFLLVVLVVAAAMVLADSEASLKGYGESCSSPEECQSPFNCSSLICECPVNHTVSQDKLTCEEVRRPKKRGETCDDERDCEYGFTCSPKHHTCDCPISHVLSLDKTECLESAMYGESCNETMQCRVHVEHSVCSSNSTCLCDHGYRYAEINNEHSCVEIPIGPSSSSAAKFSLGIWMLSCFFSVVLITRRLD